MSPRDRHGMPIVLRTNTCTELLPCPWANKVTLRPVTSTNNPKEVIPDTQSASFHFHLSKKRASIYDMPPLSARFYFAFYVKVLTLPWNWAPDTPFEDSYVNLVHVNRKVLDCRTRPSFNAFMRLTKGGIDCRNFKPAGHPLA